jgi:DNA polymerase III subunit epsilon
MIFFDTETTGLRPGSICQLSYIKVNTEVKPHLYKGKNFYFTVEEIEAEAERVHGMSVEDLYELSGGTYFEDSFEEIYEDFLDADILIGHNVNFDINFLTHEMEGCGEELIVNKTLCTMNYYKTICRLPGSRGDYKRPKLEEVIKFLNIKQEDITLTCKKYFEYSDNKLNGNGYHDARYDTAAVLLLITEGIKSGVIPPNYISKLVS